MRKSIFLIVITILFIGFVAIPANALSYLAQDFLKECRALDAPFPPPHWDKYDLRDAALEVLDEIENGSYDIWPTDFCLKTLGYTQFPEDLDRILAYEENMPYTVLRSLRGFPHEKAIKTLMKYLENEKAPKRESAVYGLADIDFRKLEKGKEWKDEILAALDNVRQKEKVDWLIEDMDKAISKIEAAPISPNENS